MQKICFITGSVFILLASCSKTQPKNDYLVQVKEYKTNTPLQGVKIELLYCRYYTAVDVCRDTGIRTTYITDENGEASFNSGMLTTADRGIELQKTQYFSRQGGEGENFMEPEAWVNLNLTAGKSYPDTCVFELTTESELGNGSALVFKAPKDSTVHLRLFGNEANQVKWVVVAKLLNCHMGCPRDTFAFGNFTLNPRKFETLQYSLEY